MAFTFIDVNLYCAAPLFQSFPPLDVPGWWYYLVHFSGEDQNGCLNVLSPVYRTSFFDDPLVVF